MTYRLSTTDSPTPGMASVYKQVETLTKDMGSAGGQFHLGHIKKLDPALGSGFFKNVVVSAQINDLGPITPGDPAPNTPGFTIYLSNASGALGWSDNAVLTARSFGPMAGTASLSAYRNISDDTSSYDSSIGPVHIWAEITDVTYITDIEARFTMEVWGRSIKFTPDVS